jgi:hypothetical protein
MRRTLTSILNDIPGKLKDQFACSLKADRRGIWIVYAIVGIIIPFTIDKLPTPSTEIG